MKTIILPGFSLQNKDWAFATKYNLSGLEQDIIVHEWFHWISERDEDFNSDMEAAKINISEEINIIAKSIGTLVAVKALKKQKINKIIFLGIPLNDLRESDFKDYEILKDFDINKCLFIQNNNDPHATQKELSEFLQKINKNIKVLSKKRNDHEYPYWEEFKEFLA